MTTATEKYIKKAVAEAKKELSGNTITNCSFRIDVENSLAVETLAAALQEQATANNTTSKAMLSLTSRLSGEEITAIKISSNDMSITENNPVDYE